MVDITAAEVFRDFVTDGVPSSGPHNPRKPDIRMLLKRYEAIIAAFTSNGGVIYSSKAAMDADLTRAPNTMAWVLGDAIVTNNGIYRKVGASGSGNWARAGDLPYSFILASNSGAGTPEAIQATTSIPVNGSALILLQIAEDYSGGSATVSFNGGAAFTIKTNSGANVRNLAAGSIVYGVISGESFRLANDEAIASLIYGARDEAVSAKEGAQLAQHSAEDARDIAAGYASDAVSQGNVPIYATIIGMSALAVPVGINTVRVNGYSSVGDGRGGQFIDTNNGSAETFTTSDGRTWYRAQDVGPYRIKAGMDSDFQRAIGVREVLHADRTYYVAPPAAGEDSNDGLSAESAWATLQHAYDFVCDKIDMNGFKIAIRLMDGLHTDGLIASKNPLGVHETSSLTIKGNPADHNAAILRVENNHAIRTGGVDGSHSLTQITLNDFRIETVGSGSYDCVLNNGGAVHFSGLVFGQCTGSHITTTHLGWTYADGAYSVAKGATNYHIGCQSNGITVIHNQTVTFDEALAFAAFVSVTAGAQAYINNVNWVNKGNVSGNRFFATLGGLVFSQYQPIDYVPGNGHWLLGGGGRYNAFDGQPERITKFGDEQRASSPGLQNDTGLFFPVEPNRFYVVRLVIKFNAPSSAGFSWRLNGPLASWVRLDKTWRAPGSTVIATEETDNGGVYPAVKTIAGHDNQTGILEIEARISNGPNAGQVAFQWAQANSSPQPTIVGVTSYLDWQLVG